MAECGERGTPEGGTRPSPAGWLIPEAPGTGWMLAGLGQHKCVAGVVWLAITGGAAAWIWSLPSVYQAEAIVLVESRRIPEQLVPATSEVDLEGRLEAARQKLLASAELRATIRKLRLCAEHGQNRAREDSLTAQMRQNLAITPVDSASRGRLGPFRVAFRWSDAETVARVANHVAWRFVEETSQARRYGSGAATQFLSTQAVSAKRELERREAALREFRLRYAEELPEQSEALRAAARRLRAELVSLREEILKLEREKVALGRAERGARTEEVTGNKPEPETSGVGSGNGAPGARPLQSEELRKRLTSLLAVYKPEHPDVRHLMAEVVRAENLEAAAAARSRAEPTRAVPKREIPPLTEKTSGNLARLKEIEDRLEGLAARRTQLAAELGLTEQRLQRVPLREQELAALTREHAFFSDQFRTLAARQQSAEMAEALERSYPSERVTVLEQARPPEKPLGPRRWWMLSAASLGGLVIGCLLAIAKGCDTAAWHQLGQEEVPTHDEPSRRAAHAGEWHLPSGAMGRSGSRVVRGG